MLCFISVPWPTTQARSIYRFRTEFEELRGPPKRIDSLKNPSEPLTLSHQRPCPIQLVLTTTAHRCPFRRNRWRSLIRKHIPLFFEQNQKKDAYEQNTCSKSPIQLGFILFLADWRMTSPFLLVPDKATATALRGLSPASVLRPRAPAPRCRAARWARRTPRPPAAARGPGCPKAGFCLGIHCVVFRGMVLGEFALGELDLGEWAFGEGLRGMFFFLREVQV